MHKKLFQIVFLCLFVILLIPSELRAQGTQDFENEKELIKVADKHFEKEEFVSALSMYSQLASTYPKNHEYNYRYGVCLLYVSEDKSSPILFLSYALESPDVDAKVYFYLAKAYHLSYRFDQAIKYYKLFEQKYPGKDFIKFETDRLIKQCETAKLMLDNIKEINVYEKKVLDESDFFRAYKLEGFKGNIFVVPVEIQTDYDIKKEFQTVTFHNPNYESIYFASKGKKGSGGSDIYRRNKLATGEWGEPIALGMNINTRYDENYPFLHPDGVTLYFCSKGHNSIGGYDVFVSKLDTNTNIWGKPINVGFAINSPGDDIMYVTDEFKNAAYFASNRENKQGEITIYKITSDRKPKNYKVVKGVVNQDGQPLANSDITVFDANTGEKIGVYQSDFDGEYYITIPEGVNDIVYEVNLRGDKSVRQELRGLSEEGYEQRMAISSDPLSLLVEESEPVSITIDDKANALTQSSSLNVNQDQDLAFNTRPRNYNVKEEEESESNDAKLSNFGSAETEKEEEKEDDKPFTASNKQIVEDAYSDAEESAREAEALKKQLDVAYMISSGKNEKAKSLASDIKQLNKELEEGYDENKAILLSSKEAELNKLKEEVLVTYNVAKSLEENYQNKQEEAEFSKKYAEQLDEAISSNSAEQAIDMLEETRVELDRIYKKNEDAFSLEDIGGNNSEKIESLKQLSSDVEAELSSIKAEKEEIIQRANDEKEDYVKQSILLDAEDLDEEIAALEAKKSKIDGELSGLESEQNQFTENQEIFEEIASAETRTFSMEEIQKVEEAKSDLSKDVEIYESSESTDEMVENLAEENEGELALTGSEGNPSADEINAHFDEIEEKEEMTPVEKLADLNARVKIQQRRIDSKKQEQEILENTLVNETDLTVKAEIYGELVKLVAKREEENKKLQELQIEYNEYNEVQDLNQDELEVQSIEVESIVLSENGDVVDFDTFLEEQEVLAVHTEDSSTESNNDEVNNDVSLEGQEVQEDNPDVLALSSDEISETDDLSPDTENQEGTSTPVSDPEMSMDENLLEGSVVSGEEESDSDINNSTLTINEDSPLVNTESSNVAEEETDEVADISVVSTDEETAALSDEELVNTPFEELSEEQKEEKLVVSYDMETATSTQIMIGLQIAFGLVTDPDFEYGPNAIVQANVNNARRLEKQAINTYVLAKKKREEASNEAKAGIAKKSITEAVDLESESKKLQENASSNYEIANREEIKYNNELLATGLATGEIENSSDWSSDKLLIKSKLDQSKEIRSQIVTTYNSDERIQKINEAYALELEVIELQNKYLKTINKEELHEQSSELIAGVDVNDPTSFGTVETEMDDQVLTDDSNVETDSNVASSSNEASYLEEDLDTEPIVMSEVKSLSEEELYTKAESQTIENLDNTALEIRSSISSASSEEKEELQRKATLLEEMAQKKRLKFVQHEYNEYFKMLKKMQELRRRTAIKDENSEELFLANIVQDEIDQKLKVLEENKEELELYAGETQISAYKTAVKNQEMLINKQTAVLKTFTDNNPNVSEEDLEFITNLPDTIQNTKVSDYQISESDPDLTNPQPTLVQGEQDDSDSNTNKPITVNDPVEEENVNVSADDLALNNETISSNEGQSEEEAQINNSDEDQTNADSDNNSEEDLITDDDENIVSDDNDLVEDQTAEEKQRLLEEEIAERKLAEEQEEFDKKLKTYAKMKADALKDFETAEKDLELAQKLQVEAEELETEADSKLKETENAATEEEIVELISDSDRLRQRAIEKRSKANRLAAKVDNNLASSKSKNNEAQQYIEDNDLSSGLSSEEMVALNYNSIEQTRGTIETVDSAVARNNDASSENQRRQNTSSSVTYAGNFESSYITLNGETKYSEDNPIPVDPAMPEDLVFKVQVGAFRKKIPQDLFKGIAPLQGETTPQGFIRYTAGEFSGFEPANMAKREIRKMGYSDAFVVVYYNGKRISLGEAFTLMDEESSSEKSDRNEQINKEISELQNAGIGESYRDPSIAELVQDVNDTKGVMYTVQIGYYSESISPDNLYNLDPIFEDDNDGGYRYMHGIYRNLKEASSRKTEVREIGISDAFVIAYKDGKKISVAEANKLIGQGAETVDATKNYDLDTSSDGEIVYKVQVGAYSQQVPLERAMIFVQFAEQGVEHYMNENGLTIYSIGTLNSYQAAQDLKEIIKAAGITDAFVVKYKDGKKI